ncbi:MAG: FkbM family methyltransferase [Syntrophaceae bacterium]|nr:FkbM family methyltransferase [Syntrophaceae bacterium]
MAEKISDITLFEKKIYSQNGEDGIIETIFDRIGTTNKFFVEFGCGNGEECNTRYLKEHKGWKGIQMDSDSSFPQRIKKEFINADNVNEIFLKYKIPGTFDLLSIDIDGNDYHVWKALKKYRPRVVIIEYNCLFPPNYDFVMKYDPDYKWDNSMWFGTSNIGASLLALQKLGTDKGYSLIGINSSTVNAFFVINTLAKKYFIARDISDIYLEPSPAILAKISEKLKTESPCRRPD